MNKWMMWMVMLVMVLVSPELAKAASFDGKYFTGVWQLDSLSQMPSSTLELTNLKTGALDGAVANISPMWHHGDPKNTLLPQWALNAGIQPISWGFVMGGGYSTVSHSGIMDGGLAFNLAPSVLGVIATPMSKATNPAVSTIGKIILGESAVSLAVGPVYYAVPVTNGTVQPFNRWGSRVDGAVGLAYNW